MMLLRMEWLTLRCQIAMWRYERSERKTSRFKAALRKQHDRLKQHLMAMGAIEP